MASSFAIIKSRKIIVNLPKDFFVRDICAFYHYKIGEVGDYELQETYKKLCVDETLKDEHKHLETKGITHVLHFLKVFKVEWIHIVLSRVHNITMWPNETVKII